MFYSIYLFIWLLNYYAILEFFFHSFSVYWSINSGYATSMNKDYVFTFLYFSVLNHFEQPVKCFPCVAWIKNNSFFPCHIIHSFAHIFYGIVVSATVIFICY